MMELYVTVKQVRGLANFITRFNSPFSTKENACIKSKYDNCYLFVDDVLELLILAFA